MELMLEKDKAIELCHMLRTGGLSVAVLPETEDAQTHRYKRLI